ncbi:MAG: proprotein convertase P-domain-containing protein [Wenzhouxiangella sp.]
MEFPIAVSGLSGLMGVSVQVNRVDLITSHTWNSDLRIFLRSPSGIQRELVNRRGSFFDNFGNPANCPNSVLSLQDGAAAPTGITGNNVTGVFAPEQSLSGFHDGSSPNGSWTVRICDAEAGDVGALQYAAVRFVVTPAQPNPTNCGLGRSIPDNGCSTNNFAELPVSVSGLAPGLGVNSFLKRVDLITSHTFNSDLRIFLRSPSGIQRELVNRRGNFGDNFGNPANCPNAVLSLQDGAAAPSGITGNNVTGVFAPEQSLEGFHDGSDPNGIWALRVCDAAAGDVGAIQYLFLDFRPEAIFSDRFQAP